MNFSKLDQLTLSASHHQLNKWNRCLPITIIYGVRLSQSPYGVRVSRGRRTPILINELTVRGWQNKLMARSNIIIVWTVGQVDRERQTPFLLIKLMLRGRHHKLMVRGGHSNLIQLAQNHSLKCHKIWLTLSTHYPINQEWCLPLGTTSLEQAVCFIRIYLPWI